MTWNCSLKRLQHDIEINTCCLFKAFLKSEVNKTISFCSGSPTLLSTGPDMTGS